MAINLPELMDADINDRIAKRSDNNLEVDHYSEAIGESLASGPLNKGRHDSHTMADCFYSLFGQQVLLDEHPNNPDAAKWWRDFFATPRSGAVRLSTVGKPRLAEMACWSLANELADYLAELEKTREEEEAKRQPLPDGAEPIDAGDGEPAETIAEMACRQRSVGKAIAKAKDEVTEAAGIMAGIEKGLGTGLDEAMFKALFDRIKRSKRLREILDIAGSMMEFRQGQRKKREQGHDKIAGVTCSSDLTRLLPSEVACLADEDLEMDMLRRMVEEQTLALDKYSERPVGRGPMVVIVDESGSMDGQPICEAKAFALTMARIAQRDKRWVCFVGFALRGQIREEVFKPEQWATDSDRLVGWIDHFYDGGGTDFGVLKHVADSWNRLGCPKGQTDVYFITDCESEFSGSLVSYFNDWKKANDVRCYGLAINSEVGDLPLVCDKSWPTHSMGLESSTVKEILSESA